MRCVDHDCRVLAVRKADREFRTFVLGISNRILWTKWHLHKTTSACAACWSYCARAHTLIPDSLTTKMFCTHSSPAPACRLQQVIPGSQAVRPRSHHAHRSKSNHHAHITLVFCSTHMTPCPSVCRCRASLYINQIESRTHHISLALSTHFKCWWQTAQPHSGPRCRGGT